MKVAIVHDYLTQRGGAERVVLSLARTFPQAPIYTSLYDQTGTFPEFAELEVRTLPLNRIVLFRKNHRAALPLLAESFSRLRIEADVVVCSSSGWAHGAQIEGRKVVYCHTPARWLYQSDRYLRGRSRPVRAAAEILRSRLERWDKQAAATADAYIANSTVVAERIKTIYGIDAEVLAPPPAITPEGPAEAIEGLVPGFFLCVSRLLPYKNVDAVVAAFGSLPEERLAIVGSGPVEGSLRGAAGRNVIFVGGQVTDPQLRWLYANCQGLVAASHEDFGLTPVEAGTFGKPTAALRWGGFLDTVDEGRSGVFFNEPTARAVVAAIDEFRTTQWSTDAIRERSSRFSDVRFAERILAIARPRSRNPPFDVDRASPSSG
jgi:glycosyltransferase involved in cell wall biosynthesis